MTRVSPLGWATSVLAVVCLVVGVRLAWGELVAIGAAAGVTWLLGLVMTIGRARLRAELDLADHRVRVGERAVGRVALANVGPRRTLPTRVELAVGTGVAEFLLPSLAPGASHDELFALPTRRRQVIRVGPVRTRRGDPLGLVSRTRDLSAVSEVFVHPRIVPLAGANAGLLRDLEGQATRDLSDSDMSFHALRDYVAGDDRRMIHWRTSARRDALMVRQFEDTRRTQTAICLATHAGDYADEDEFELAVQVVASLALHVVADERDLRLVVGPERVRVDAAAALLDGCTRVQAEPEGDRTAALGRRVAREAPAASTAYLVTGSSALPADLRDAVRGMAPGTRAAVLRCAPREEIAVRTEGQVTRLTLTDLAELPRALRLAVRRATV